MRQGQHSNNNNNNKNRSRNRGRRQPNPSSRVFESNGPDVRVRGTAAHIAEKYLSLGRDAQASGDIVQAENYLQHAEHYLRIVSAAQAYLQQQNPEMVSRTAVDDDEDSDSADEYGERGEGFASQRVSDHRQDERQGREHHRDGRNDRSGRGEWRDNRGERGEREQRGDWRDSRGDREARPDGRPQRDPRRDGRDSRDTREGRDHRPRREQREGAYAQANEAELPLNGRPAEYRQAADEASRAPAPQAEQISLIPDDASVAKEAVPEAAASTARAAFPASDVTAVAETPQPQEAEGETKAAAKPKRQTRTRKASTAASTDTGQSEAGAAEPGAAEAGAAKAGPAEGDGAEAEQAKPAPRKRRAPARSRTTAAADVETEARDQAPEFETNAG